jgi:hypothetical protein
MGENHPTKRRSVGERSDVSGDSSGNIDLNGQTVAAGAYRYWIRPPLPLFFFLGILQKQDYGRSCLARLHRLNPRAKKAKPDEQERLGKEMIVADVDRQRKEWAPQWLYYGYNPFAESFDKMSDKIEKEIWANWIIAQDFGSPRPGDWGADGIQFSNVAPRLVDLDIIPAREAAFCTIPHSHARSSRTAGRAALSSLRLALCSLLLLG